MVLAISLTISAFVIFFLFLVQILGRKFIFFFSKFKIHGKFSYLCRVRILLAVSGGVDSMYLARHHGDFFPGDEVAVVHCNFALRGAESDGDEAFVRSWASSEGMECHVKRFGTAAYASEHGVSIEMAARELRYRWFAELCSPAGGWDAVAVAHNANDNAETLLLNLLRGCGPKGLRGMSDDSLLPVGDGRVRVLRPMLGITRAEIERWMLAGGHPWREDRTNAETDCKRNKLRNQVFPLFAEINPSFLRTLGEDMERFSQASDILDDYYREAADSVVTKGPDGLPSIAVRPLLALKHWEYVLWRVLEPYGFSGPTFGKLTALLRRYAAEPLGTVTLAGKKFESPSHTLKAGKRLLVVYPKI